MSFTHLTRAETGRSKARRTPIAAGLAAGLVTAATWWGSGNVAAQAPGAGRYFPFDHTIPPGQAALTTAVGRHDLACAMQPIRVELPGEGGQVSFYTAADGALVDAQAPALAAVQVGAVYRLKLSRMPDFPGVELYPTVELLDRLHPPRGREAEFPVPIAFTEQEIRYAVQGRLITKVVYLEQPDRALPVRNTHTARTRIADPRVNVLAAADEAGRPMAIVRLGARTPDPRSPEPGFFGQGAAIQFFQSPPARAEESLP